MDKATAYSLRVRGKSSVISGVSLVFGKHQKDNVLLGCLGFFWPELRVAH
jgi:hypothetical protein